MQSSSFFSFRTGFFLPLLVHTFFFITGFSQSHLQFGIHLKNQVTPERLNCLLLVYRVNCLVLASFLRIFLADLTAPKARPTLSAWIGFIHSLNLL